jgi:hypothetical protein
MSLPSDLTGFPINSVTVVIAYETTGGIEEVVHQVDGKKNDILSCIHNIERKAKAVTDKDGSILKYETTGEQTLILKVKFIKGI